MTFSEAWKRAGQNDEYDPDDGNLHVRIVDASAFAGRDGREWAKVVLQVDQGDDVGRQFDHFMNLNNEVGLRMAREALVTYGLDAAPLEEEDSDIDDLSRAMFELVGRTAEITVSHKDGFRNTRVHGSHPPTDGIAPVDKPASFAAAIGVDPDDAPF